jgi:hypothetical protein
MTGDSPINGLGLITQMRAGTHYMCAGLRIALEATIYRPDRDRRFVVMDDEYIRKGLHSTDDYVLPRARPERIVHFCHYYHPQKQYLAGKRIYLIGFPLDSFYSDGVVATHASNDPAPSGPRAASYIMRAGSPEWVGLEDRMRQNAEWLTEISESDDALVLRYEDFFTDFDETARRLESFAGKFVNPLPEPTKNPRRTYWTEDYSRHFDHAALAALCARFSPSIEKFYPERIASLEKAL